MDIDPLEVIITWLEAELTSVSARVAAKHRYGDSGGWTDSQTGVSVHLDGGPVDLYAEVQQVRLELRLYAPNNQVDVVTIWQELVGVSRDNIRFTGDISGSKTALVHYFLPLSTLSLLYDEVLKKELGVVFFEAMVSEDDLS